MEKDHPRYSLEEIRKAYYIVSSLTDEIENGNLAQDEIKEKGQGLIGDKEEALSSIELVGHLLEVYGA